MKLRFLILVFILVSNFVNAQLDTTKIDTVRLFLHVADTTHYWDYFNANGVLAWGYVKEYDPALIPPGGSAKRNYYKNQFSIVKGFGVIKCDIVGNITVLKWLDINYKAIKNKYVTPNFILR